MAYIPPISQQTMARFTGGTPSNPPFQFPPNLAATLPDDLQKKIMLWMFTNYIWPQIMERMPFEAMWDKMLEMFHVSIPSNDLFSNVTQDPSRAKQESDQSNRDKARVSDTVVHDAIERLTDITYFISFKEGMPVQYVVPDYIKKPQETPLYKPTQDRIDGGNAILIWNSDNWDLKRNSRIAYQHHYTYGLCYILSDYHLRVELINRRNNQGQIVPTPEITEIGTSFTPISIRKIWLNWRLPVYDMDSQPCPFFFEETPRFSILDNQYDPQTNPFGYVNLDKTFISQYIYSTAEMSSVREALQRTFSQMSNQSNSPNPVAQILRPEHSVEAKWKFFPMLPFDPQTLEFETRADGTTPVPMQRFVMETFGPNVHSGAQILLRLQQNYYPKRRLPLYGSTHMPDLDSGQYAPSVGQILYNHYKEITLCMEQYLTNKDLINDPPSWVQVSSPASNVNLNQKGAKIMVNGPNDFGWKQVYDGTNAVVEMLKYLRDGAQTTSKAVDAILGKAMGSRTSATEASNAFQASMSAITTDIDMVTNDLHGGYAQRVWDYTATWFDSLLLKEITGQFGFQLSPEDMWMSIGLETNVGSTYVEKVVKQQNYRYILESSRGEPYLDRAKLWTSLLDEMGFDGEEIVNDGGQRNQIEQANLQACKTLLGIPTLVDPDCDHSIFLQVLSAYIKDQDSVWMTNPTYAANAPKLMQLIQQHQLMLQLQQQQQLAQMQMENARAQLGIANEAGKGASFPSGSPPSGGGAPSGPPPQQAGGIAQQGGGAA